MLPLDRAAGLAVMARELSDDCGVYVFGYGAAKIPARRGFGLVQAIKGTDVGHATYMEKGHQLAKADGYDRVIIITDEQAHDDLSSPAGKGYVINVAAYENGVGYHDWTHIDGFSENTLRFARAAEAE